MYISQQSINMDRRKRTLIIVRRTLAGPNAGLAGVIPVVSAWFKALAVAILFSEERTPSRSFDP